MALPGSAYLYQGEELGLPEVGDVPSFARQDPTFFRKLGVDVGRDGCRVPLPWTASGDSFGFSDGLAHLPQPEWFGPFAVEAQELDPASTLSLYRHALALRHELQADESLIWLETGRVDVLAFRRSNGWTSVTNFGSRPFSLDMGDFLVSSAQLEDDGRSALLPGATTVWLRPHSGEPGSIGSPEEL
jgi:alpha-glucosidase